MLVKIETKEVEILEFTCALFDLSCKIYTIENNPLLVQAEVRLSDGSDLDGETGWLLHCSFLNKLERSKI